ncbi:MAG: glycosyltransferase family 39 protein [Chloroflexi bacterium]|nr:glycosyltransferase family 39 protein [Chloroflexota bacterium]
MSNQSTQRAINWIPVLLIALAAILLRVYALDRLPPGLFGDEAVEGLDALDVLAGNFAIWFHAHLGREPIYVYLVALAYAAFGITPLATRLPAIIAGLLTIPAAFFLTREWAMQHYSRERATRLALLATALLAISFWHVQMTRDAHRDTLLPLVEALGYWLLWRALRTGSWKTYASAGAVLGLAIYTYSPGRFVPVFVVLFFAVELLVRNQPLSKLAIAALAAIVVMLPLGIYFAQNPVQFSRRFESVSILDAESPPAALAASVAGNLAQFVVPDAGYQSKHYNLPGKPVFDLFIAPWFLAGLVVAITRWKRPEYRFLLLWFAVMLVPAFLTADMIPKAVRALGVVPGVFIFPALAMDWAADFRFQISDFRFRFLRMATVSLIALSFAGSAVWTAYDYFVTWANMPELPLAFDADMTEVAELIQRQPSDQPIYISSQVYRPPTLMLLGRHVPTTRYLERATRIKEFDATSALVSSARHSDALYVWVREQTPPAVWLARLAPHAVPRDEGTYFATIRLGALASPQQRVDLAFNPLLKLVGYSRYSDEPRGIALYWQVNELPPDREDLQAALSLADARGALVTQDKHKFGVPPLEWAIGDTIVEWYALDLPETATQFSIELKRGALWWQSPALILK